MRALSTAWIDGGVYEIGGLRIDAVDHKLRTCHPDECEASARCDKCQSRQAYGSCWLMLHFRDAARDGLEIVGNEVSKSLVLD